MLKILERFSVNQIIVSVIVLVAVVLFFVLWFVLWWLKMKLFTTDTILNIILWSSMLGTIGTIYKLTQQNWKKLQNIEKKIDDLSVNKSRWK